VAGQGLGRELLLDPFARARGLGAPDVRAARPQRGLREQARAASAAAMGSSCRVAGAIASPGGFPVVPLRCRPRSTAATATTTASASPAGASAAAAAMARSGGSRQLRRLRRIGDRLVIPSRSAACVHAV
jgi:hypothetical protein